MGLLDNILGDDKARGGGGPSKMTLALLALLAYRTYQGKGRLADMLGRDADGAQPSARRRTARTSQAGNPRPADWETSLATFWAVEEPELVGRAAASGTSSVAVWEAAARAVLSVARRVAGFSVPG